MPKPNGYKTQDEIMREDLERIKATMTPEERQEAQEQQARVSGTVPTVTTTGTETQKTTTDSDWYNEWVKQLEPPMSAEERARRERAAYISSGIVNLGNAFGALGNMFVAQHGAPAQKMPTTPDVDAKINAFRDRADKVRNAYLNGMAMREKMRQQDALLKNRRDTLDYYRARENRLLEKDANNEQWREWLKMYQQGTLNIRAEQNRINEMYRKGLLSNQAYRNSIAMLNALTHQTDVQNKGKDKITTQTKTEKTPLGDKTTTVETSTRYVDDSASGGSNTSNSGGSNTSNGGGNTRANVSVSAGSSKGKDTNKGAGKGTSTGKGTGKGKGKKLY